MLVSTAWEEHNLPVILITGDQWDPINVNLVRRKMEQTELIMNLWHKPDGYCGNEERSRKKG